MRSQEGGYTLIVVLLVILTLTGLGSDGAAGKSLQFATGTVRVGEQALQAAQSGLVRVVQATSVAPDYFHRLAVTSRPDAPTYTYGQEWSTSVPIGVFPMADAFGGDPNAITTRDRARLGRVEYRAVMSNPRMANTPPGFQVAGGSGNRFVFYMYRFNVTGWINRAAGGENVSPGTAGARRVLQADVRLGPMPINQ